MINQDPYGKTQLPIVKKIAEFGRVVAIDTLEQFKKEHDIKSILNSPRVSSGILTNQFDTMIDDQERTALICNGKFLPLSGKFSRNKTKTVVSKKEIQRACQGDENSIWFHSHGTFTKRPSLVDERSNKKIFEELPFITMSCISGADGVHCGTKDDRFNFLWGDPFYDRVNSEKAIGVVRADKLFCDRTKKGNHKCEAQNEGGVVIPLGSFGSVVNNGIMTMDGRTIAMFTDTKDDVIECLASKSKDGVRSLSCSIRSRGLIVPSNNVIY